MLTKHPDQNEKLDLPLNWSAKYGHPLGAITV